MIYALDTNIIIHYLRKEPKVRQKFNLAVANENNFVIPMVVNYELMRGFRIYPAPNKEAAYKILIGEKFCDIAKMDDSLWQRAIDVYEDLYHKRLTIDEMDILIAAYCLENNCILVTNNVKDFKNIDGLIYEDWTV